MNLPMIEGIIAKTLHFARGLDKIFGKIFKPKKAIDWRDIITKPRGM